MTHYSILCYSMLYFIVITTTVTSGAVHAKPPYEALNIFYTGGSVAGLGGNKKLP